jgi:GNAT superfamily N-acetyltransferase
MAALDGLLGRWLDKIPAATGDSAAVISWPSRDYLATDVFSRHGLLPLSCIAVRGGVTPVASAPGTDATVRTATVSDLGDIVGLRLAEIRFAESFLATTERSFTRTRVREAVLDALQTAQPWVWVAERSGRIIGTAIVSPPEQAQWIAPMVGAPRPAYIDCVSVIAGQRGAGVGSALVAAVLERLDQAGVVVSLLHHSLLNPLSAPFWARHGYRPLWMVWERRRVLG